MISEEELEEIENTLKIAKPYCELGSYHYFNCESIEKLLNQNKKLKETYKDAKSILGQNHRLKQELTDYKERCKKAIEIINEGLDFDNPQYAGETQEELLEILDKKEGK